jgi:hypothetical protein
VTEYREWLANSPVRLQEVVSDRWVTMTLNALALETPGGGACPVRLRRCTVAMLVGIGLPHAPGFQDLPALDLEVTRELVPRVIGVPCHTKLTARQVSAVCACLLDAA